MITIRCVQSDADIQAILNLQRLNLKENVSIEQHTSEGFVTLEHSFDLLSRMNQALASIVATDEQSTLIGYTLAMLPNFADEIPMLDSLFDQIHQISFQDKPLRDYTYYVMGQSCVAHGFRGRHILKKMLEKHRELYHKHYQLLITSISNKNPRSLAAHLRTGFTAAHAFFDEKSDVKWHLLVWNWNKDQ